MPKPSLGREQCRIWVFPSAKSDSKSESISRASGSKELGSPCQDKAIGSDASCVSLAGLCGHFCVLPLLFLFFSLLLLSLLLFSLWLLCWWEASSAVGCPRRPSPKEKTRPPLQGAH